MSHKGNTETFYREIINKLTEKMKDEYNNEGIGEDTLLLMKKKWEEKLIQQGIFIPRPNQMAYLKHSFNNRAFINQIEKTVPFNTFKSAPSNTTTDNIKSYIESKNNSIQQQYPMNQVAQPRFYTSTQQLMMNQNLTSMITDYPKQIQEVSKEIKKVAENIEEIKEEDDKEKESVDSEYEIFNQVKNQKGNKEENNHEQKEDDDETLSPLSNDSEEQEIEAKDFLLAQYEKVHRIRNKWKITFKDAVLHFNGKEYVFDKVVGELDRDW